MQRKSKIFLFIGILISCMILYTTIFSNSTLQTTQISISNEKIEREAVVPQQKPVEDFDANVEESIEKKPAQKNDQSEQKQQVAEPNYPKFSGPTNDRMRAVHGAMKHAWKNYKEFAWGRDHLKPISKSASDWMHLGLTIVDSLDTLLIMGMDEGGLLSAFHLTGDKMFLQKAEDIGSRLAHAFSSPSAVPFSDVNLRTKKGKPPSWSSDSSLAEVSSIQLEFRDLGRATNNNSYETAAFRISEHIHHIGCNAHEGLCDMFMSTTDGRFKSDTTITFGARSDSYYEYLLKQWLQTGKKINWLHDDYKQAMQSMIKLLLRQSEPNKFSFVGELLSGKTYSPKMDHLVCFLPGTLALGTLHGLPAEHLDVAKNLAKTCKEMYNNPTGLGPEIAHFNMLPGAKEPDLYIKPLDAHCLLRPEAFEAWYYLHAITGDSIYQDWGWEAFQAIEKYAKVQYGYSSVNNVKKIPVQYRDMMESFFLAESLKYLYLLFADEPLIKLNEYVFNTEAHPLPIRDS